MMVCFLTLIYLSIWLYMRLVLLVVVPVLFYSSSPAHVISTHLKETHLDCRQTSQTILPYNGKTIAL